jgi:hypothetical protein
MVSVAMTSLVASLFIFSPCLASLSVTECIGEECARTETPEEASPSSEDANILLQGRASLRTMQVEAPSIGRTEALLQRVQTMVHTIPPDHRNEQVLDLIKSMINDITLELMENHHYGQTQLDERHNEFNTCFEDINGTISYLAMKKQYRDDSEDNHRACRSEEGLDLDDKTSVCGALNDFITITVFPTIPDSPTVNAALRAALRRLKTLAIEFENKDLACNQSSSRHALKAQECFSLQEKTEMSFCGYRREALVHIGLHNTCHNDMSRRYNTSKQELQHQVTLWKHEYTTLKKIECYLDVWLGDGNLSTVNVDGISSCESASIDTAPLDIFYYDPLRAPYDFNVSSDIAPPLPMEEGWFEDNYAGLPGTTEQQHNWTANIPAMTGGQSALDWCRGMEYANQTADWYSTVIPINYPYSVPVPNRATVSN